MDKVNIAVYTDGSYSREYPSVTYGAYIVLNNTDTDNPEVPILAQRVICENPVIVRSWNAGGELIAATTALINALAILQKLSKAATAAETVGEMTIFHDYKGVEAFVRLTGKRDCASKLASIIYVKQFDTLRSQYPKVTINFKWVKSHSGVKWNEAVDALANGIVAPEIRICLAKDQRFRG